MKKRKLYIRAFGALLLPLLGILLVPLLPGNPLLTGAAPLRPGNLQVLQAQPPGPIVGVATNAGIGKRFQFPQELVARLSAGGGTAVRSGSDYARYGQLMDTWGAITVSVPDEWSQVEMGDWIYGGQRVGRSIAASPDLEAFYASGNVPGVFFGASTSLLPASDYVGLDTQQPVSAGGCNHRGVFDYQDAFYGGMYDYYVDCAGNAGAPNMLVLTTKPASGDVMLMLRITLRDQKDLIAALKIFSTYQVIGDVDRDNHHGH